MRVANLRQWRGQRRDGRAVLDRFHPRGAPLAGSWSINRILDADGPLLHSHPYAFCESLILAGGYTHEFFLLGEDGVPGETQVATFRPDAVNFMPGNCFHRIVSVEPGTVTWLAYGPALERSLEYWVPGRGPVPSADIDQQ